MACSSLRFKAGHFLHPKQNKSFDFVMEKGGKRGHESLRNLSFVLWWVIRLLVMEGSWSSLCKEEGGLCRDNSFSSLGFNADLRKKASKLTLETHFLLFRHFLIHGLIFSPTRVSQQDQKKERKNYFFLLMILFVVTFLMTPLDFFST
ncbi:uncharacterized protein LOC131240459 [Magnolia sinica]|uniref:uncharacterized protein LOC131240459 n=1 Tax=Magnolia sinica TaxID=86752 RepID=UPI00265B3DB9|nr:uncharacterized protein LOC131240459 [Magnolia sinica]